MLFKITSCSYASLLGLFRLRARSWMTKSVCYYYTDNFLHFCIETHESQTCLTLAKTSSIMEKLLTSFGAQCGYFYSIGRAYKYQM